MPRKSKIQHRALTRAAILYHITRHGAMNQAQLAGRLGIKCYSIARMLHGMVAVGDLVKIESVAKRKTGSYPIAIYKRPSCCCLSAMPDWLAGVPQPKRKHK